MYIVYALYVLYVSVCMTSAYRPKASAGWGTFPRALPPEPKTEKGPRMSPRPTPGFLTTDKNDPSKYRPGVSRDIVPRMAREFQNLADEEGKKAAATYHGKA